MVRLMNARAAGWALVASGAAGAFAHAAGAFDTTSSAASAPALARPAATTPQRAAAPAPEQAATHPGVSPGDSIQGSTPAPTPRSAAGAARPGPASARLERVIAAPWGGGKGSLGHEIPAEGAPVGPMSFVVDARGRVFVLDQVNARVALFDGGAPAGEVRVPGDTFQDLELDGQGGFILLDRHQTSSLAYVDAAGNIDHEVALVGPGIAEATAVTAIFRRDDGVWAEVEHARLVRVADEQGKAPASRKIVEGRFGEGGRSLLRATLERPTGALISEIPAEGGPARDLARARFGMFPAAITGLEQLSGGRVLLSALLVEERAAPPYDVVRAEHALMTFGPDGRQLSRDALPDHDGPEELFRPVRLGADGAVYALRCAREGAEIWRYLP
jgi:hypothetical protein